MGGQRNDCRTLRKTMKAARREGEQPWQSIGLPWTSQRNSAATRVLESLIHAHFARLQQNSHDCDCGGSEKRRTSTGAGAGGDCRVRNCLREHCSVQRRLQCWLPQLLPALPRLRIASAAKMRSLKFARWVHLFNVELLRSARFAICIMAHIAAELREKKTGRFEFVGLSGFQVGTL